MMSATKQGRPKEIKCVKGTQQWLTPASKQYSDAALLTGQQVMTRSLPKISTRSRKRAKLWQKPEQRNQGPEHLRQLLQLLLLLLQPWNKKKIRRRRKKTFF